MALDFTKYWMTQPVQAQLTAKNGWPAMRSDALGDVADWQQPYFKVVNEALALTKPRPNVTYWGEIETILSNAFNDVVTGGQNVKDTLERYQQEIDKAAKGG